MNMRWLWIMVLVAGCARRGDVSGRQSRLGETCGRTEDCEAPLRCVRFECVAAGRRPVAADRGGDAGAPPGGPPATPAVPPPPGAGFAPSTAPSRRPPPTGL
jgi:hypothetical protein